MFNEALFQEFPGFAAWYANVYDPSGPHKSGRPSRPLRSRSKSSSPLRRLRVPSPIANSSGSYEELPVDHEAWDAEHYLVETQPDVPEYYAPPSAASRQPEGPDAPWVRAASDSEAL